MGSIYHIFCTHDEQFWLTYGQPTIFHPVNKKWSLISWQIHTAIKTMTIPKLFITITTTIYLLLQHFFYFFCQNRSSLGYLY